MFHSREFRAPVMSPLFHLHQSFDDITLDDIRPYFLPLTYLTDGEFDSDTRLMPTISLDSDPLEPSYLSYHVESDPSKPSHPSVIGLTSNLSSFSTVPYNAPPPVCGRGFIRTRTMPADVSMLEEEDVVMLLPVGSGMDSFRPMGDVVITCEAKQDSPFCL